MKCDICDKEFMNSEEVKLHKEREHPLDERPEDAKTEKPMEPAEPIVTPVPGKS